MKTTVLVAIAVAMGARVWAGDAEPVTEGEVTVCMEKGDGRYVEGVAEKAQVIASKMFARIGVKLVWQAGQRFCQTYRGQVIAVSLSNHTAKNLLPGALAYALPYEGVHVEVFYDRMADTDEHLRPHLLAHVLVHEITHILQGTVRHSDDGIMKARWNDEDFSRMMNGNLRFTKYDLEIIRASFAGRAARQAPLVVATAQ